MPLPRLTSACRENSREKPAPGDNRDHCGHLLGGEEQAMLHQVAGEGGDKEQHQRNAQRGGEVER